MSTWKQSLDAAGVREPESRRDYDRQRDLVARARRTSYLAARLLLPRALLPHVVAATAMMHHSDDLLDTGPKQSRVSAWASWEREVREALETGVSTDPLIRALLNSAAARPELRVAVERYLDTATVDLEFTGFATEADYQAYVDAYSLPAFMLVASLLGPRATTAVPRGLPDAYGGQPAAGLRQRPGRGPPGRTPGHPGGDAEALLRSRRRISRRAASRRAYGSWWRNQIEAARVRLRAARALPVLTQGPGGVLLRTVIDIECSPLTRRSREVRGCCAARRPRPCRPRHGRCWERDAKPGACAGPGVRSEPGRTRAGRWCRGGMATAAPKPSAWRSTTHPLEQAEARRPAAPVPA
ncbi:squalene/phytoene synthase family protein [Streptomyces stelliscabiei]|uniref:squalene/phytoene synthase family protein n=1 Tax=Streptomyces stelliscabiei TaxID=146820 RepID=UPI003A93BA86